MQWPVYAQDHHEMINSVIADIRGNRIQEMGKYMDNFITITINNTPSTCSHNQAEVILHDFFDKHNPEGLHAIEQGTPDNSSSFIIGTYTAEGNKYTVYVLLKLNGNKYLVEELRISKE